MRGPHTENSRNGGAQSNSFRTVRLADWLEARKLDELREMHSFWCPKTEGSQLDEAALRSALTENMMVGERIRDRLAALGSRMSQVFHVVLQSEGYRITLPELSAQPSLAKLSPYDLEAALILLQRHAFVVPATARGALAKGQAELCVPVDVAETLVRQLSAVREGVFGRLTLRGFLERMYADPARQRRSSPAHLREMYKMYVGESACVQRIEKLPDGLRALVEKVILEFGGILPRPLFERMENAGSEWEGPAWSKALGESLVGTVCDLDLRPYGVAQHGPTLIVFSEVALAWFRRVAVPGDPDRPYREMSMGVNTLSNLSRFLTFVQSNTVRVTLRGEMFKSTWKRIEAERLEDGQTEIPGDECVRMLYRFARQEVLIDTTAERALKIAGRGRTWGSTAMATKLQKWIEFIVHEPIEEAAREHDVPLRRTMLRMLRHLEPGTWYDLVYLPFLARNQHICNLDEWQANQEPDALRDRRPSGDLQRMAWSLVAWVRRRLFPLGLLDLGYDGSGRAVAIRLTRQGALALGLQMDPSPGAGPGGMGRGSLVVTPDFELVLFPGEDDAELVYDLDRFAERAGGGSMKHFRLTEGALHRGLLSGMQLQHMRDLLQAHSRTPIPKNVHIALSDWALKAGLFFLSSDLRIRSNNAEHWERFIADPGVKPYIESMTGPASSEPERSSEQGSLAMSAQMKGSSTAKRMRRVLLDLDYFVELE